MTGAVTLPLWLVVLLGLLALFAVLDRMLMPGARWFLRQRTNRVIDEINTRLHLEIRPFQHTRRQVLIDRLLYDPKVQEAAEAHAREHGTPRAVVMDRVARYAREIVPSFNAYIYFRVGYWLARRLTQLLYRVRLGYSDEAGLAAVGLRMLTLRHLVSESEGLYAAEPWELPVLRYYANSIAHLIPARTDAPMAAVAT